MTDYRGKTVFIFRLKSAADLSDQRSYTTPPKTTLTLRRYTVILESQGNLMPPFFLYTKEGKRSCSGEEGRIPSSSPRALRIRMHQIQDTDRQRSSLLDHQANNDRYSLTVKSFVASIFALLKKNYTEHLTHNHF